MAKNIMISTSQGRIRLLHFEPSEPANKKILCIHGYCCDARIFGYIGKELSKRGFDVYSIDLFGHGQSDGLKGDLDFDNTIKALNEVITQIQSNSRIFLLGHSLGCTYALWYARKYGKDCVDGMILMAPYIHIPRMKHAGDALPSLLKFIWLYFARQIIPNSRISATKVVRTSILRTSEVQYMMSDPEVNYHYSYRYIIDVLANRNKNVNTFSDIRVPILLLHGRNDTNIVPQVSIEFYKFLKNEDKSIKVLDCDHWFYHALFYTQNDVRYSEQDRMHVINTLTSWLDRSSSSKG
jgi:alpha-beta hydrolase superfamily lysophospholipase